VNSTSLRPGQKLGAGHCGGGHVKQKKCQPTQWSSKRRARVQYPRWRGGSRGSSSSVDDCNYDGRGLHSHDAAASSGARDCFALPEGFAVFGLRAHDTAAPSVARDCFALPDGFAAMAPSALPIAAEKSIDSTRSVRWSWPSGSRRCCFVSGTRLLRVFGRLRRHCASGANYRYREID
jgi:hypothetical protein